MNSPYDGGRGQSPGDASQTPRDPSAPDEAYAPDRRDTGDSGEAEQPDPGPGSGPGSHPGSSNPPTGSPAGSPTGSPPPDGNAFAHLFQDQGHQSRATDRTQQPGPEHEPTREQPSVQTQDLGLSTGWDDDARTRPAVGAPGPYPFQHQSAGGPPPQRPEGAEAPSPGSAAFTPASAPAGTAGTHGSPAPAPLLTPESGAGSGSEAEAAGGGGEAGPSDDGADRADRADRHRGYGDDGDDGAGKGGGRGAGLLRSSAIMAAGTMVSRLTGFIRSAMIVAALGGASLADTYQLAIQLPTMLYILTVGGGLNSVFVPQLVRAMKEDEDGGEAFANRLLTIVVAILGTLAVVAVLAAPLLVRMMSVEIADNPPANSVAVTFVRYCLPSIFFMGIHVVMGQILNARGRFGAMMWTPVLNNLVIMAAFGGFIWVYGTSATSQFDVETIPPEGVRLLGIGTMLGLVVQALAMIPYLRAADFRVRPRFDWRGQGLGKSMGLAKWTILFVLANQAGNLVVTQLSTAAQHTLGRGHPGSGYTAYAQAQLIWNMPQAIITVSVMAALLPRLSRAASDGDVGAVRDDISQGLRNSAVAIVPIAFGFLALGIPLCQIIYNSSGTENAHAFGYVLMAFGVGLIPFSVQYVVLRAFYAYEDTRTPFFNTVIIAVVNAASAAACYLVMPARTAVIGMAACYGLAYVVGVGVAWRRLRRRLGGDLDGSRVLRTYIRLAGAAVPATAVAGGVVYGITAALGEGLLGSLLSVVLGGIALMAVFVLAGKRMRIAEMTAMVGMVRARLGR